VHCSHPVLVKNRGLHEGARIMLQSICKGCVCFNVKLSITVLHETLLIDEITLHHSISCAGNTWQCVAPLKSLTWYNGLSAVCYQANSKMVLAADHLFSW